MVTDQNGKVVGFHDYAPFWAGDSGGGNPDRRRIRELLGASDTRRSQIVFLRDDRQSFFGVNHQIGTERDAESNVDCSTKVVVFRVWCLSVGCPGVTTGFTETIRPGDPP